MKKLWILIFLLLVAGSFTSCDDTCDGNCVQHYDVGFSTDALGQMTISLTRNISFNFGKDLAHYTKNNIKMGFFMDGESATSKHWLDFEDQFKNNCDFVANPKLTVEDHSKCVIKWHFNPSYFEAIVSIYPNSKYELRVYCDKNTSNQCKPKIREMSIDEFKYIR